MFWTVVMTCSAAICSVPEQIDNPAFSFYATREACERRIALVEKDSIKMSCVASDTVTFHPGFGFTGGALITTMKTR